MIQFKLIKDGSSVRKHDLDILKATIQSLTEDEDSYVILEPKTPIENSIYIQAIKQNDGYLAEIRFVFDSDDNFKHYSRTFNNEEDLFKVFSQYYSANNIPDLKKWEDETNTFEEETQEEMVKLYKEEKGVLHYFEVWLNDDEISLTTHYGILGETGETEEVFYDEEGDLPVKVAMAKLVSTQRKAGYAEKVLTELILQYYYNENEDMTALLHKRHKIEELLNDCLGWTGNGHCDGGDIGSGTMNIFCYIVDKNIAVHTILEVLEEEHLVDGLKIAYADEDTEEYIGLYPPLTDFLL